MSTNMIAHNKYHMFQTHIGTIIFAILLEVGLGSEPCERLSTCSCKCKQGLVDFNSLSMKGGPRYKDLSGLDSYKYSYNPCDPFTETYASAFESHCQNVASCQVIQTMGTYQLYDAGTQDSVTYYTETGNKVGLPDINYDVVIAKYVSADNARHTEVILICNQDTKETAFDVVGEISTTPPTYRYYLVSPHACFNEKGQSGLSAGSILLIVVFSIVGAYVIVGIALKKFVYNASGKDLLPNSNFWCSLPEHIKAGCLCVVRRGKLTNKYDVV